MVLTTTESREELIEKIIIAASRPCPAIVEAIRSRCKKTGKQHSIFGMPYGFKAADYETIVVGYVYTKNGTTYGTVYESRDAAESAHAARAESAATDLRKGLELLDDALLGCQAEYWLKRRPF